MAGPGLFDPLGADRVERVRTRAAPRIWMVALCVAVAAAAGLIGVAWLRDDGDRGEPLAVAPIVHLTPPPNAIAPAPPAPVNPAEPQRGAAAAAPPPAATAVIAAPSTAAPSLVMTPPSDGQDVEIQNGVRIIRPRRDHGGPGPQTRRVPDQPATPR